MAKVLFVDDEPGVRDVFVKLLEYQGHQVRPAPSGEAAIEVLSSDVFDVVITDQMLPGMKGLQLAERIRALGLGTPVVVLTGQLSQELADEAERLDVFECVAKPVTGERVGEVVARAIAQRR